MKVDRLAAVRDMIENGRAIPTGGLSCAFVVRCRISRHDGRNPLPDPTAPFGQMSSVFTERKYAAVALQRTIARYPFWRPEIVEVDVPSCVVRTGDEIVAKAVQQFGSEDALRAWFENLDAQE